MEGGRWEEGRRVCVVGTVDSRGERAGDNKYNERLDHWDYTVLPWYVCERPLVAEQMSGVQVIYLLALSFRVPPPSRVMLRGTIRIMRKTTATTTTTRTIQIRKKKDRSVRVYLRRREQLTKRKAASQLRAKHVVAARFERATLARPEISQSSYGIRTKHRASSGHT